MLSSNISTSSKTWNYWTDRIRLSTCLTHWNTKFLRETVAQQQPTALQPWTTASPTTRHKAAGHMTPEAPLLTEQADAACPGFPFHPLPPLHSEPLMWGGAHRKSCPRPQWMWSPHACGVISRGTAECQEGWVCGYVVHPRPRKSVSTIKFLLCWKQNLSCGCDAPRAEAAWCCAGRSWIAGIHGDPDWHRD